MLSFFEAVTDANTHTAAAEQATLLVVDDVEDNRDFLSRRFRKHGFRVVEAEDGPSALAAIAEHSIALVILDITMPGMSGFDVLRTLRESPETKTLPVIMASARTKSEHMLQAFDLGANDYVTKPIDFPVLKARVISALRAAKAVSTASGGDVGPGSLIAGRYRLEDKLGEGGFGTVYRAIHTELQRPVAVKVLHRAYSGGDILGRFRQEGVHACRVQHPNALTVMDSGVVDDVAFLAMELLDGHSLEEAMAPGPLPFVRCAEILAPVCEALSVAHSVGIVHRDVKPGNVFLHQTPRGEVPKVLDFGIAKLVGDAAVEHRMTMEGSLIGTPAYMSPERFRNHDYDGKADVYSVGVMLNQMITGRLPFRSVDGKPAVEPMALAMLHTDATPVPLRSLDPGIPGALETLVLRALSKDPGPRPTAIDVAHALRAVVAGLSPAAVAQIEPDTLTDFPTQIDAGKATTQANAAEPAPVKAGETAVLVKPAVDSKPE